MKIGLIDVDGIHRKKKWGGTIHPNLALCKIAAYHKAQGDDVEWAVPVFEHYDVIYRSKIFNFSEEDANIYDADVIIKGGTGYDLHSQLAQKIDDTQPDFSIYPNVPSDVSYGFLTRGCPNKCRWCVVPKKEGGIHPYWDVERVANGRRKLVLMDNNILAAGDYCTEQLGKIISLGYKVDFNQALDARLVNEENARLLANVKWLGSIRFGCDTTQQIRDCERAIELIDGFGYHGTYFLYTMIGGWNGLEECYERIMHWWRQNESLKAAHKSKRYFPNAQPYRDPMNVNDPPQWQKDMARWTNNRALFSSMDFKDYSPRKGFVCRKYFTNTNQIHHGSKD